jgi:hypothetical protein
MREIPELARQPDRLPGEEPRGLPHFPRHLCQALRCIQHRRGLDRVDDAPEVVGPRRPDFSRGVATEDAVESGTNALRLLGTQLRVAERGDHSVDGHRSMLRVGGVGVSTEPHLRDIRVAADVRRSTGQRGREWKRGSGWSGG